MVLVVTSVWVDHFRRGNSALRDLLRSGKAATQPFVIGEIACGNLKNRRQILESIQALPMAKVATQTDIIYNVCGAQ